MDNSQWAYDYDTFSVKYYERVLATIEGLTTQADFNRRLNELAEDRGQVLSRLREKLPRFDVRRLNHAASHYGTLSAQRRLTALMEERETVSKA